MELEVLKRQHRQMQIHQVRTVDPHKNEESKLVAGRTNKKNAFFESCI